MWGMIATWRMALEGVTEAAAGHFRDSSSAVHPACAYPGAFGGSGVPRSSRQVGLPDGTP